MRIERRAVGAAGGTLLVHNVADGAGRKVLAKGTPLTDEALATLRALGHAIVLVAVLADDDIPEDAAAERLATALLGEGLRATRGIGGRVNLHSEADGVLYLDASALQALNELPGLALATRAAHAVVGPRAGATQVATLKVIPYALPRATLAEAEALATGLLRVAPLRPQRVALLLTAEPSSTARLRHQFEGPTRARLEQWGAMLASVESVGQDEAAIAGAARQLLDSHEALIIGGQTSIMDPADTTPRALAHIGATGLLHGAPVEPGNLLALAYRGEQWILGAPGCAKSAAPNIVDLVLPRLLAGERLDRPALAALGLGGLL